MPKVTDIASELKQAIDAKDERQIAFIASEYSAESREKIAKAYSASYGKDVSDDIKKALKGGSEEGLLMDLFNDRHEVRAQHVRDALSGKNDVMAFFDTILLCTPEDWHETVGAYTRMFKKNLPDEFAKDAGDKDDWCILMRKWMNHERYSRPGSPEDEARRLEQAFDGRQTSYLIDFFATVPHAEYRPIAEAYKAQNGKSIEQAIATIYTKSDYYTFYCAHFALLGLHRLAAYLINCACNDKGDEKRMRRITGLMVDKCLGAKHAYKIYGDMGSDIERCFDKRMAPLLRTLWRVK